MKRTIITIVILLAAFSLFSATADQKVTLKGSITTANRIHPELKSGTGTYQLMLPRYLINDIKDGDTVEVEGFTLSEEFVKTMSPNFKNGTVGTGDFIFVSKITYNGKTVDVQNEKGNFGPNNNRDFGGKGRGMGGFNRNCPM